MLDRAFKPQQNKQAIEPNGDVWLNLRRAMGDERMFSLYDDWLLECHKKFDYEVSPLCSVFCWMNNVSSI